MPLIPGTRLGAYEVLAELGRGGMGEVYRARDTQLDREVALKILPQAFAADPDRLARFEREAKTLAALNHPNIAAIYGIESGAAGAGQSGVRALVMELVPGPTLEDVIALHGHSAPAAAGPSESASRGPAPRGGGAPRGLSIEDTVSIACQIADALECAHDNGIIHRDLKPANIKVRDDGTVKLLDFGLARAMDSAGASGISETMSSPTMMSPAATQQGVILGTAGYMSPEQARGRVADKRSDIWAFGVVLYELLTGKRLFTGDTVTEIIATVIKDAPDLSALPVDTPPRLRALLERCLDRDVKTRLRDIGEARVALLRATEPLPGPLAQPRASATAHAATTAAQAARRVRELLAWTMAGAAIVAAVGLWLTQGSAGPQPGAAGAQNQIIRTMIPPPDGNVFDFDVTVGPAVISPDGRHVAFSARSLDGRIELWVRALDSTEARAIEGTDGASFPFWSPNSKSIGFYVPGRGRIERVDLAGGAPVAVVRAGFVRGASWGSDGTIAYDASDSGTRIAVVNIAGGDPRTVVESGFPRSPWILPGNTHLLYFNRDKNQVHVVGLDGKGDTAVTEATSSAIYASGQLLFMREDTLLAQPFDLSRRAVSGSAVAIAKGVQTLLGDPRGVFSASETGILLYQDGAAESATSLAWFDRDGKRPSLLGEMGTAKGVVISPDGLFAALAIGDAEGNFSLWRINLTTMARNRLTFRTDAADVSPFLAWAPDSRHIAYGVRPASGKRVVIARTAAEGGQGQALFDVPDAHIQGGMPRVTAWTKDASAVLYSSQTTGGMWRLPLTPGAPGAALTATQVLTDVANAQNVQLSPNERWIAYQASVGAGTVNSVFVDAYPGGGNRQQLAESATLPLWSVDGKSLYMAINNQLSVVDVTESAGAIRFSPPRGLMPVIVGRGYSYDVAKDGRILALVTSERRAARPLTLVQGWMVGVR